MQVNAAYQSPIAGYVVQGAPISFNGSVRFSTSGAGHGSAGNVSGYITNGTGSVTGTITQTTAGVSGSGHVKIPITLTANSLVTDIVNSNYYSVAIGINPSISVSGDGMYIDSSSISSWYVTDFEGNVIINDSGTGALTSSYYSGTSLNVLNQSGAKAQFKCFFEFDVAFRGLDNGVNGSLGRVNYTLGGYWDIFSLTSDAQESLKEQVNDSKTQQAVQRVESSQNINNQIAEDTRQTSHGILDKITAFFGSFFQNFIDSLKSLFIPEDGYFTNWFTRLNTLLSAKLGMLYAPFDLVISVLTALGSASTSEAGIPFPELSWDGQVIIPAQTFYFSSLGSSFSDLRDAVYFGTDVVLLFAFLVLLQRKINLVMRGSEEG